MSAGDPVADLVWAMAQSPFDGEVIDRQRRLRVRVRHTSAGAVFEKIPFDGVTTPPLKTDLSPTM